MTPQTDVEAVRTRSVEIIRARNQRHLVSASCSMNKGTTACLVKDAAFLLQVLDEALRHTTCDLPPPPKPSTS